MHATRSHAAAAGLLLALAVAAGPLAGSAHATDAGCGLPVCIADPQPPVAPAPADPQPEPATTTTTAAPPQAQPAPSSADARATLLARMNRDRAEQHLPALTERADVDAVAAGWSSHLADAGALSHNDEYFSAASRQRLDGRALGENVAQNGSPEGAHDALMASPHHRANILDARFTVVGLGAELRNGSWWITEDFLQPRDPGSAGAAAPAPSAAVTTRSSAGRPAPAAGVTVEVVPSTTAEAGDPSPLGTGGLQIATGAHPSKPVELVPSGVAASHWSIGSIVLAVALAAAGWCCRMVARRRLRSAR
jgi:uncharacterized protein YkwD